MTTIPLGAMNKKTGEYIYPKIANKIDEYSCVECHKDLILCKGNVRVHHFRHKIDTINPCHHYSCPTESQIHKDAKLLLKTLLEKNICVSFIRKCYHCKNNEEYEIPSITNTSSIELEYRFEYNGKKIADIAYIDNGEIVCIFEICHTHKTKNKNRPEPWFETDALSLIQLVNDIHNTELKINCIRSEKCDICIHQEIVNVEKKKQALDILYNWFQTGIEIPPFYYDYSNFAGSEKNLKCEFTNENFDLILYLDPIEKYQRYCIRLIYNSSNYYFTKEEEYSDNIISLFYLDTDWILQQNNIPSQIKYIASLDYYNHHYNKRDYITCINCKYQDTLWVKRINIYESNYKVFYIGGGCCKKNPIHDTEYINCNRCNSLDTPLTIMETNRISQTICKNCDIELYSNNNIYLYVPFNEKDELKKLGGIWDSKYKKWFINKNHKNIDIILQKWNIFTY
jgi:uncharacterized protein YkuJ